MRSLFSVLLFVVVMPFSWGQSDYSSIIKQDLVNLSVGLGHQYGFVGVSGTYSVTDYFGVSALLSTLPKVGIEFSAPQLLRTDRLEPYLKMQYGISERLTLSSCEELYLPSCFGEPQEYKRKTLLGPTLSIGTKFKLFKRMRGYGTISADYNYISESQVETFHSDFNEQYATSHEPRDDRNLYFSVGYTYLLSSSDPEYKR